jgi:hypothetical protein
MESSDQFLRFIFLKASKIKHFRKEMKWANEWPVRITKLKRAFKGLPPEGFKI